MLPFFKKINLRKKYTGFTLIELMVVISILAILGTIAVSVYSNFQKNNRDQQRLRDLNTIKQALELYRSDNGVYPETFTLICGSSSLRSGSKTYLDVLIQDPLCNSQTYQYQPWTSNAVCTVASDCTNFVLCAKKEGSGSFGSPSPCEDLDCAGGSIKCDMGVISD